MHLVDMVEEQLPEDGEAASLRQVFPAGTNKVLTIAPLKREYYDLLLGYLEKGFSYEVFPNSPDSSEDELASEEVPPSSASSDSGKWFWRVLDFIQRTDAFA